MHLMTRGLLLAEDLYVNENMGNSTGCFCFWYKEKCLTIAFHHFQRLAGPDAIEQKSSRSTLEEEGAAGDKVADNFALFLSSVSCQG